MSLLLDALKKAADENKKDATSDETNKDDAGSGQIQEEDLDLELVFSEQEETPEFPQVNQEVISQNEEIIEKNENRDVNHQLAVSENVADSDQVSEIEIVENNINILQDAVVTDEYVQVKDDSIVVEQKQVDEFNMSTAEFDATDRSQRENVVESERKHTQHMEALSALINKNNTFNNRRRRFASLSVVIFILFLLIAASFYAYTMLEKVDDEHISLGLSENKFSSNSETVKGKGEATIQNNSNLEKPVASNSENERSQISNQSAVSNVQPNKIVKKQAIQIRKNTIEDPVGVLISRAYAAFIKSDYQTAETVYRKVIDRDKNNHDALLGLAAIAVKQNRNDVAKRIYSKLLKLDPKDSYAKAGMSALINQKNSYLNESQLKIMLREQSDAGHLYFALGNILLNQNRFAEAQSAFFSAWSIDKLNTDYALNLAISLDYMGKSENALEFYQLTMELFEKYGGNVSVDKIEQRMELIKGKYNG